jgi:ribosomal protein L16 Arg81 hydroxylase
MILTPEQRVNVTSELKRIGAELNLSDDQKQTLQSFLTEASEKVEEFGQQNPNPSKEDMIKKLADNRASLRQRWLIS